MSIPSNVVELPNRDGTVKSYKLFSARLPEFMEKYPASEGWRVERSSVSAASKVPELMQLHLAAVTAGKSPTDLQLPPIPQGMIFRAALIAPNGEMVRDATSLCPVRDLTGIDAPPGGYKDWEAGETAAFQRLIAAMGFDGELLASEEMRFMPRQRADTSTLTIPASTASSSAAELPESLPKASVESTVVTEVAAAEPLAVVSKTKSTAKPANVETVERGSSAGACPVGPIALPGARVPSELQQLKGMNRQVAMVAKQKGVSVPEAKSFEEAKKMLADLMSN